MYYSFLHFQFSLICSLLPNDLDCYAYKLRSLTNHLLLFSSTINSLDLFRRSYIGAIPDIWAAILWNSGWGEVIKGGQLLLNCHRKMRVICYCRFYCKKRWSSLLLFAPGTAGALLSSNIIKYLVSKGFLSLKTTNFIEFKWFNIDKASTNKSARMPAHNDGIWSYRTKCISF